MKKAFKIVLIIILVITVIGTGAVFLDNQEIETATYPEPTEKFFVEDYAGVLNEDTERYIFEEAVKLDKETKAQVVVVTVPDEHYGSLEEFSIGLANKWGIGDKELDNGVLLLFEVDDSYPHVRLEIGKGLEGAINDGMAGRILDENAVEEKDKGLYNKAAGNTFTVVAEKVYAEYGLTAPETLEKRADWQDGEAENEGTFGDAVFPERQFVKNEASFAEQLFTAFTEFLVFEFFILLFLAVVVIVIIIGMIFPGSGSSSGRSGHSGGSWSSGGGGGFSGGGGSFGGGGASR